MSQLHWPQLILGCKWLFCAKENHLKVNWKYHNWMGRQTTNITSQLGGKHKLKQVFLDLQLGQLNHYSGVKARKSQEYRNFSFHLLWWASQDATLYSLHRSQTWLSTPGSKDRLWIVITGAAFPQRLSMEATLRLDWIFNVSHSCVRDKRILNVFLLGQNLKLNWRKRRKRRI